LPKTPIGLTIAPITLDGFAANGIVSERHSGFKEGTELAFGADGTVKYRIERPKFHRMVQFLSKVYSPEYAAPFLRRIPPVSSRSLYT
jgi:hypothetical protein